MSRVKGHSTRLYKRLRVNPSTVTVSDTGKIPMSSRVVYGINADIPTSGTND